MGHVEPYGWWGWLNRGSRCPIITKLNYLTIIHNRVVELSGLQTI